MRIRRIVAWMILACLTIGAGQARTFTDASGRTIEAEIIEYDGGESVKIRRGDAQEFSLPLARLSAEDQAYIRAWEPEPEKPVDPAEIKRINELLGAELLSDGNLWDDDPAAVAQRLGWPLESKTKDQSSYRKYNQSNEQLLGARPYSSVLYGRDGKVDMISIVFANKGDAAREHFVTDERELRRAIEDSVEKDGEVIAKKLGVLGEPEQRTTATGRNMKERQQIWQWNDHALALAVQDEEYVAVRIMPAKLVENRGRPDHVGSVAVREAAKANVEQRANGDVIITNLPMVDQGPKGYCAPATMERVLRYMGVRADMYLLAMAGQTDVGGGTSVQALLDGAEQYLRSAGREMEIVRMKMKTRDIAKSIDEGQPILWTMLSTRAFNQIANDLTQKRAGVPKIDDWKKQLRGIVSDLPELEQEADTAHICLIIGYNKDTDEIAVSDSWGPEYAVRWVPAEVAEQITTGGYWVIDF